MPDRALARDVHSVELPQDDLDPADVLAGSPRTGSLALDQVGDIEVGIWELSEGTVRDTEEDEVFVVLAGDGTVVFEDDTSIELTPGVAVRLRSGERTRWEIRSTLRKIYVA